MRLKGVTEYTKLYSLVEVNFPENDVCCFHCSFFNRKLVQGVYISICHKTNEPIENCEIGVGEFCPLKTKEEVEQVMSQ